MADRSARGEGRSAAGTPYVSVIEGAGGTVLHIARPDAPPEDIPLSLERQCALLAALAALVRHAV